ncbi:hypothetical protein PVAND_006089 [Polypedilum vanderplanki]|uniref:Peptidase S1 domain-containing protein n=1 Tax=Polypedilum vanderplanki TaxID=319348 RepID=A0A9J6C2Y6_POLVA|nr:hypothetical protein PVAND_006089 [Polypedilum vanderplanki]
MLWITNLILFASILNCHGYENIEGRVVNGVTAKNIIPYQASIRVSVRDYLRFGRGHTCGGVLISRRTVTTAAHCLTDGARMRTVFDIHVVFGSLNRYIFTDETVIMHAEKIIMHPKYRRFESLEHDIGLVILRRNVELSDIIHPIPLIDFAIPTGNRCQISGWGATQWRGLMPLQLQKANVSIVDRNFCNASYSERFGTSITYGMVCANGQTESGKIIDACQGDSGGPLQCDDKLVGLSSFGVSCGASFDIPGVYVDIYYYHNWIMENWKNNGVMQKSHKTSIFMFTLFVNLIWNLKS